MIPLYILRDMSLFKGLSSEDLKLIASRLQKESYPKGVFVFKEGDVGDAMYLVESGQLAACRREKAYPNIFRFLQLFRY